MESVRPGGSQPISPSCRSCLRRSCWHRPRSSLIPLSAKGPPRPPLALPLRSATTPRGAVNRGRASAYRRRGRSLETVAPRMLRWSSFRMRQQEMMQDMK